MRIRHAIAIAALACLPLLGGCVKGILPDPDGEAKKVDDEAAATGAGCRQAGRSLEECYQRNEGLNRNGGLRGWREMDEYMRQNKLDPQPPSKESQDKDLALKDASKAPPAEEAAKEAPAPAKAEAGKGELAKPATK